MTISIEIYSFGLLASFLTFLLGFLAPIVFNKPGLAAEDSNLPPGVQIGLWASLLGSLLHILMAIFYFGTRAAGQDSLSIPISNSFSWTPDLPDIQWLVRIDSLSAFFCILIGLFSAGVAIYSFGALRAKHYYKARASIVSAFNVFVWSTLMAVLANDIFTVIIFLEFMTLSFGFLSLYKYRLYSGEVASHTPQQLRNARLAPQVYMIISHASTAFLLLAFTLLAIHANSFSLDEIRDNRPNGYLASIIFLLAFIGLGIRAGLTPAHIWVSLVHPSSPTTTHAFSLGIAIKVAIYLMYRFFFQFLAPQPWWGYLILGVAAVTAFVNVWYALASHDLKVALAYHSIENFGIIVSGIGVAIIFSQTPDGEGLSHLALIASLYHLLNHAIFKGLLYLGTGSIDNLTSQTMEFDRLGGLVKLYPFTSFMFLIGSFSIAGFPPFNGFVSEYLTLASLFEGMNLMNSAPTEARVWGVLFLLFSLIMLVTSFVMTAICFYKIYSICISGEPRTKEQTRKETWSPAGVDSPASMLSVMGLFALLCLILGIFPTRVIDNLLLPVLGEFIPVSVATNQPLVLQTTLPDIIRFLQVGGTIALVAYGILWLINKLYSGVTIKRGTPQNVVEQWNYGTPYRPSMQVSSGQLVFLIQDAFQVIARPPGKIDHQNGEIIISPREESFYQYLPSTISDKVVEGFSYYYDRIWKALLDWSGRIGCWIHPGDIRQSLMYILVTNIMIMLLYLVLSNLSAGK